jgi:hypothetical protein
VRITVSFVGRFSSMEKTPIDELAPQFAAENLEI